MCRCLLSPRLTEVGNEILCFCSIPGVGKLRPAGQMRPAKGKSAAREHFIFLNGMRPVKENFAAREHVNVAR